MDALLLSRIQFGLTVGFHFLFPPISIGLAWLLVWLEWKGWKRNDTVAVQTGKFYAKLLALTFAVGVATGIVMEFQFGTNWSRYSTFVGDIFGAPLAAEGVFAFFLESTFLGLYLFGRKKVSPGLHWFSILMVAVGSTISAFWILVANSWQQTPAGYVMNEALGRAELTSFYEAVFNPSMMPRFLHTISASMVAGAFFMAGTAAFLLLKNKDHVVGRKALTVSVWVGLIFSILTAMPTGHHHAQQVARTQPEKFAAIEGVYETENGAPLLVFGLVHSDTPKIHLPLELPLKGLLSWMAFGDFNAEVKGINDFPKDDRPPLWGTFVSFHNMVLLGGWFIFLTLVSAFLHWKGNLWSQRKVLWALVISTPLPLIACQFGWFAAEVGRQPWAVYKLLRTADSYSPTVGSGEILFSIILFSLVYLALGALYLFVLFREVKHEIPSSSEV